MTPFEWAGLIGIVLAVILLADFVSDAWTELVFWGFDRYFNWRDGKSSEGSDFSQGKPESVE